MALVYCCTLNGLIASIVLICTSLWIQASAKLLNVNVLFWGEVRGVNNGRLHLKVNCPINYNCSHPVTNCHGGWITFFELVRMLSCSL